MLHPSNGIRPVAKKNWKCASHLHRRRRHGRSLLRELRKEEQQMVTVTKLHKKNIDLMFFE